MPKKKSEVNLKQGELIGFVPPESESEKETKEKAKISKKSKNEKEVPDKETAKVAEQDGANEKEVRDENSAKTEEQDRPSTAAARKKGRKEGTEQRKIYLRWKQEAMKHEKDNYSKLYVVHEKKNWWKMFGHSAILFHYDVSKWANMKSRLQTDSDYNIRSEEGNVNIKDVYEFDKLLAKVNVNLLFASDDLRIYNIGKKYTEEEINAMIRSEELEWAQANQTIKPKEVFPALYTFLLRLLSNLYFLKAKMSSEAKASFGEPMVGLVVNQVKEYVRLCNRGGMTNEDFLEGVGAALDEVKAYIACLMETRTVKLGSVRQALYATEKVRRVLDQCSPTKV